MRTFLLSLIALAVPLTALAAPRVELSSHATPRERYAAAHLREAVTKLGGNELILLAVEHDPLFASFGKDVPELWPGAKEAFVLKRLGNTIVVEGSDPSGVLYGTEELIDRIHAAGTLPEQLDFEDHPQLNIRGAVIGLQKPEITYEGAEYDYPYTQKDFPWFYDKAEWTKYLDQLAEQRTNALFLWNGHPFTSLLKLRSTPKRRNFPRPSSNRTSQCSAG